MMSAGKCPSKNYGRMPQKIDSEDSEEAERKGERGKEHIGGGGHVQKGSMEREGAWRRRREH